MGRQPWIVYGLLRTLGRPVAPWSPPDQVAASIAMFTAVYLLLFAVFVFLLNDKIRHGPDDADLQPAGKLGARLQIRGRCVMNFGTLDLNTVWFALVGVLFTGYVILDGFDLGVGVLHLFAVAARRGAARLPQRHRPGVGRQRGVARHGRRRAVRGVPGGVCHGVLRLLPRVHGAAVRADLPRGGDRVPQQAPVAALAGVLGRRLRGRQPVLQRC